MIPTIIAGIGPTALGIVALLTVMVLVRRSESRADKFTDLVDLYRKTTIDHANTLTRVAELESELAHEREAHADLRVTYEAYKTTTNGHIKELEEMLIDADQELP